MNDLNQVVVTSSPHIKTDDDTRSIMLDVVVALVPALVVAIYMFGIRVLTMTATAVITSVLCEYIYNSIVKKSSTIGDLSSVVTGILVAFNMPVSAPLYVSALGSVFAIVVVKCLFGGIGKNFMNPALAARAFLLASFPGIMATWVSPHTELPPFSSPIDVITTATPLFEIKTGQLVSSGTIDLLLGQIGGCIGETSAVALIVGGLYLLWRRVIGLRIPVCLIGTVAILTFMFPLNGIDNLTFMTQSVLSGGLILGSIYMATDYTTSPVTPKGQVIFAVGCGLITVLIRYFGSYSEGISYAILIMNALVWPIDKYCRPRIFGHTKPKKTTKEKDGQNDKNLQGNEESKEG